jgi:hypothetical protein
MFKKDNAVLFEDRHVVLATAKNSFQRSMDVQNVLSQKCNYKFSF